MDKSDGVGGKSDKRNLEKSGTSEDGGKVHKKFTCGTYSLWCYH